MQCFLFVRICLFHRYFFCVFCFCSDLVVEYDNVTQCHMSFVSCSFFFCSLSCFESSIEHALLHSSSLSHILVLLDEIDRLSSVTILIRFVMQRMG